MNREGYVESTSTEMGYRVWGAGKHTWILVHGWLMTGEVFAPLCEELELPNARILAPDLRGMGDSRPEIGEEGLALWQKELVDLVTKQEAPVTLLGHSLGGLLAQLAAADIPERVAQLILLLPVSIDGYDVPADFISLMESTATDMEARQTVLDHSCLELPAGRREWFHALAEQSSSKIIARGLQEFRSGAPSSSLNAIACPTRVISTDDVFITPELLDSEVIGRISNAKRVHLPGAGHYPQVEVPAALARLLESFSEHSTP